MEEHIFEEDIEYKGNVGEDIFIKYMNLYSISFTDVRQDPEFRKIDVDFIIENKWYDVKHSYKEAQGLIYLETFHNKTKEYGKIKEGWLYLSWADFFIFTSEKGTIIQLENNQQFMNWFNRNRYTSIIGEGTNKDTKFKNGRKVTGAYACIELKDIPKEFIKILKQEE